MLSAQLGDVKLGCGEMWAQHVSPDPVVLSGAHHTSESYVSWSGKAGMLAAHLSLQEATGLQNFNDLLCRPGRSLYFLASDSLSPLARSVDSVRTD